MLHAILRGKFVTTDDGAARDREDHLTAAVLERLAYLPAPLAHRCIETAIGCQVGGKGPHEPDDGAIVAVDFWPRLEDASGDQAKVEPDAVLQIGAHVYIIEAKRYDRAAQYADQLVRNWMACREDAEHADAVGGNDCCTLVAMGGVESERDFRELAEKVGQTLQDRSRNDAPPRIVWIPWKSLADAVRKCAPRSPASAKVLDDIFLALAFHGFRTTYTFEQLRSQAEEQGWRAPPGAPWPPVIKVHDATHRGGLALIAAEAPSRPFAGLRWPARASQA